MVTHSPLLQNGRIHCARSSPHPQPFKKCVFSVSRVSSDKYVENRGAEKNEREKIYHGDQGTCSTFWCVLIVVLNIINIYLFIHEYVGRGSQAVPLPLYTTGTQV